MRDKIALIGFGEAASSFAADGQWGLRACAFDRDQARASAIAEAGVVCATSAAKALTDEMMAAARAAGASYSSKALARVWKSARFSWALTKLMHRFPDDGSFLRRMQVAELDYIASSRSAQTSNAENYVGLPL